MGREGKRGGGQKEVEGDKAENGTVINSRRKLQQLSELRHHAVCKSPGGINITLRGLGDVL